MKRGTRSFIVAAVCLALVNIAYAAENNTIMKFSHKTLKNGMELYMRSMDNSALGAVYILFKGGFKDEPISRKGISHLVEHVIFRGTERHKAEDIYKFELNGGMIYGGTGFDRTTYGIITPSDDFEEATKTLMDMVFNPAFRDTEIVMEKKIILQEDRERELSQTSIYSLNLFYDFILRHDREGIMNLSKDDIIQFHRRIYRPENAVVVAAGNFNLDKLAAILEERTPVRMDYPVETEYTITSKAGQTISREIDLESGSYQLLMAYELGELALNQLFPAKLLPYLIGFEGLKFDYLNNCIDITYELGLDKVGSKYYLLVYYESGDEEYTDEIGRMHKEGMLKIIKRLTEKDFSREMKRIGDIMEDIKIYQDYSAVTAVDLLISCLYSTGINPGDLEALKKVTNDDIHNFTKENLYQKPYAWIVVKDKKAKEGNK
ncbi:MAG: M16 family metallopeptidase [Bacillota bacterium]